MEKVIGVLGALLIIGIIVIVAIIICYLGDEQLWIFSEEYWKDRGNKKISTDCNECKIRIRNEVIEEFVKWAYVTGIDFSFMGKIKENGESDVRDRLDRIKEKFYADKLKERQNE